MDEISQIHGISERKIDFLERLKRDCEILEDGSDQEEALVEDRTILDLPKPSADPRTRDLMVRRIDKAIQHIKANYERMPETLNDLRNSLDDVSSMIAQNQC